MLFIDDMLNCSFHMLTDCAEADAVEKVSTKSSDTDGGYACLGSRGAGDDRLQPDIVSQVY